MLMPNDEGLYTCEADDCDFATVDVFDFLDHIGVDFDWAVRLNKRYSFDLFEFLYTLSHYTDMGDLDAIYDHVQSAALLMVNASGPDIDEFIEESVVATEMPTIMNQVEGMLRNGNSN